MIVVHLNRLIFLVFVFIVRNGLSQNPLCDNSVSRGFVLASTGTVFVDPTVNADPVCIRCGRGLTLFTNTDEVTYSQDGVDLVNNTNGIVITNEGLILEDPADSFSNDDQIRCSFDNTFNLIAISFLFFNPPSISPSDDPFDIIEGNNLTLTCTRNSSNYNGDVYQWTLPDNTVSPPTPAASPIDLDITGISRSQSGLYICTGERSDTVTTHTTNITLNVQYPGKILSFTPTDNTTVVAGDTLTLNCTFEGNPSPSVTWTHNGSTVDVAADPNLSETLTEDYSLLDVTFASINDTGEYACVVSNSIGSDQTDSVFFQTVIIENPGPVTNLIARESEYHVCLLWAEPTDNGGQSIVSYTIQIWNRDKYEAENYTFVATVNSNITTYSIENLVNGTEYSIQVSASNEANGRGGLGPAATITVTTMSPLPVDGNFNVSVGEVTADSAVLYWSVPAGNSNVQYRVQFKEKDASFIPEEYIPFDADEQSATLVNLSPNTDYDVRVTRIEGSQCIREVSRTISFTTDNLVSEQEEEVCHHYSPLCKRIRVEKICEGLRLRGNQLPDRCYDI